MKKIYVFSLLIALFSVTVFAQQKPKTKPKETTTPIKKPTTQPAKKDTTKKTTTPTQTTQPKTTTSPAKTEPKTQPKTQPKTESKTKSTAPSKSKSKSAKTKKTAPTTSVGGGKQRRAALPYYQIQNFITMNMGLFYFKMPRTTTLPIYFNPELTLSRNFTVGIQAMHYQYKDFIQYRDKDNPDYGYTEYPDYEKKYNHLLLAAKLSYHLNDIVRDNLRLLVNPEKLDLYVSGLAGYNLVFPNGSKLRANDVQFGFAVGGRVLYSRRLAFFMEYGINAYGYGSVGASWLLGERF